jgi:hypothetical protein
MTNQEQAKGALLVEMLGQPVKECEIQAPSTSPFQQPIKYMRIVPSNLQSFVKDDIAKMEEIRDQWAKFGK